MNTFDGKEDGLANYIHPGKNLDVVMADVLNTYFEESFCFFDEGKLRNKVGFLQDNFLPESPEKEFRRIAYAVKANPRGRIIQILSEEGINGFDCASSQEINQILSQNPDAEIFFNNPIMKLKAVLHALERNIAYFTVQSRERVKKIFQSISDLNFQDIPEIAVRLETLNPEAGINLSEKFGATEEDASKMLKLLKYTNALTGLAINTGSQNTSPRTFEKAIEYMARIARSEGGVNSLNLGGGIPVNYFDDDQFDIKEYLTRINRSVRTNIKGVLDKAVDPKILIELGRSIIADTIDLVIPVLAAEIRGGKSCVYMDDGLFTSFSDNAVHGWKYNFKAIGRNGRKLSKNLRPCVLFGRTCDSEDKLSGVNLPENLNEGDFLWVPNAGAYMDCQTSYFNGFAPPKYVSYNI